MQIFSLLLPQKLSSWPGLPKMTSPLFQCLRKFPQPISSSSSYSTAGADMSVSSSNRKSLEEKLNYSYKSENAAAYRIAALHADAGLGQNNDNWYSWYTSLVMEQLGLYSVTPEATAVPSEPSEVPRHNLDKDKVISVTNICCYNVWTV